MTDMTASITINGDVIEAPSHTWARKHKERRNEWRNRDETKINSANIRSDQTHTHTHTHESFNFSTSPKQWQSVKVLIQEQWGKHSRWGRYSVSSSLLNLEMEEKKKKKNTREEASHFAGQSQQYWLQCLKSMGTKIILTCLLRLTAKCLGPRLYQPFSPCTVTEISFSWTHICGENVTRLIFYWTKSELEKRRAIMSAEASKDLNAERTFDKRWSWGACWPVILSTCRFTSASNHAPR